MPPYEKPAVGIKMTIGGNGTAEIDGYIHHKSDGTVEEI